MQSICASCKCVLLTRRRRQFSNTSICICKNLIAYEWRKTSSKNEINTRCMLHFDVNKVCDGSEYFISVFNSVDLFLVRIHTAEFLVWFNCHRILNQSMNDANACHSMADYHDDTRTKPTIKLSKQLTLNRRRWTVQWTYIFRLIDIIFIKNFFRTFSMHFKPEECVYFSSSDSVYCSVRTHLFIDWFFVFICNCKCGESEKERERERESGFECARLRALWRVIRIHQHEWTLARLNKITNADQIETEWKWRAEATPATAIVRNNYNNDNRHSANN